MRRPLLSSRVTTIRWLGIGQLIMSIIILILGVAIFAVDFQGVVSLLTTNASGNTVTTKTWIYQVYLLLILAVVILGMLAGIPAAAMSRYEGLIHNISLKNQVLVNSVGNGFVSIFYLIFAGTDFFEDIDTLEIFDSTSGKLKAVYALLVVIFVLSFFNMVIAFSSVVATSLWTPKEPGSEKNDYIVEEPPTYRPENYVREERIRADPYYDRKFPNTYYGPGYRTLPALKYY